MLNPILNKKKLFEYFTTRSGLLTAPLRARFGINLHLEYYDPATLQKIIKRSAMLLKVPIEDEAAVEISRRSRGTPRIANSLLRRVRDFAQVKGNGTITYDIAQMALKALNIDQYGLDEIDNKILTTIIDKFRGGPVGVSTIATAIGEDGGTVEADVFFPSVLPLCQQHPDCLSSYLPALLLRKSNRIHR